MTFPSCGPFSLIHAQSLSGSIETCRLRFSARKRTDEHWKISLRIAYSSILYCIVAGLRDFASFSSSSHEHFLIAISWIRIRETSTWLSSCSYLLSTYFSCRFLRHSSRPSPRSHPSLHLLFYATSSSLRLK